MEVNLDRLRGKQAWADVSVIFIHPSAVNGERQENIQKPRSNLRKWEELVLKTEGSGISKWKFGKFISCNSSPMFLYTEPWLKENWCDLSDLWDWEVIEKRSKNGRKFFGCSRYPVCDFTSGDKPTGNACPNCGGVW